MVEEKIYAKKVSRPKINYDERLTKVRLGMNEYRPNISKKLCEKILENMNAEKLSSYPNINSAYTALSKYLNIDKENLLITSGADMAIRIIFEALCNRKDIISTIAPSFEMYRIHAEIMGCEYNEYLCGKNGEIGVDILCKKINDGTKLLIIANPNGVTGYCFNKEQIRKIAQIAQKNNVILVIDETYGDYGNIDVSELLKDYSNLIIIRSFSKNVGLAGLRIGYVISSKEIIHIIDKFNLMMEINSVAVEAIKVVCKNEKIIENAVNKILKAKEYTIKVLEKKGYRFICGKGNFILIDMNGKNQTKKKLDINNIEYKENIQNFKGYIRLTIGEKGLMKKVMKCF